jgi:hypothetical protein
MSDFSLEWLGAGSLASALKVPIKKVSVPEMEHGMAFALTLWRVDGTAIKFYSKMHDLDEREEVGVLSVEPVPLPVSDKIQIELPDYFLSVVGAEKLSVDEQSGVVADSGIVIQLLGDHELIVVSGRFPCSISISGIPNLKSAFEPEWPIEKYRRSSLLE